MPRHFSAKEKEEIRENLILAGLKMFTKYGFSKTTIADITQEAKVGKGTFYSFFETKGDIFTEIYTREWMALNDLMEKKYLGKKGRLSDLISEYIHDNREHLLKQPLLSVAYDGGAMSAIADKGAHDNLAQFAKIVNEHRKLIVNSWIEANHIEVSLPTDAIVGMMSCIGFLNFHRDAVVGVEFSEMIDYLIKGISLVVTENDAGQAAR